MDGELEMDAKHVYNIIGSDPKIKDVFQTLTHQNAHDAIVKAFDVLSTPLEPSSKLQKPKTLTPGACMVVSLLQQLLVRLFTKRLMLLMTTEAIILNRNRIPSTYLENYLCYQAHFSLRKNITNCYAAHKATLK